MANAEKDLIDAARKLSGKYADLFPEGVLYGFAKLSEMDYDALDVMLAEESIKLMESVRDFFKNQEINPKLFRQYFSILASVIEKSKDRKKKMDEFFKELDTYRLQPVLDMSVKHSYIPLKTLFSPGASPEKIFDYQKKLRSEEEKTTEDKKKKEVVEKKDESESVKEQYLSESDTFTKDHFGKLREKYKKLRNDLLETVQGQEQAILKFIQGYNQGELLDTVEERKTPKAHFFFFGPPGTGKTLLANTAAKSLGLPFRVYNMSTYQTYDSMAELTGVSKQYKTACAGQLTGFVHKNPECVLILDEFEKAHINIIRLFLQVLGSGRLRDSYLEKDVDFSKAVLIFTSNVGRQLYDEAGMKPSSIPFKVLVSALREELSPEICSRLGAGNVIMFNHLGIRKLSRLVERGFENVATNMNKAYGIDISFSDKIPILFLLQYGSGADARIACSRSELFLKNEIYNLIERESSLEDISNIHFDIDLENSTGDIRALFTNEAVSEIVAFCGDEFKRYFDRLKGRDEANVIIHYVSSAEEAKEKLKNNVVAVFVDPLYDSTGNIDPEACVFDYSTESNLFFRDLMDMKTDMPVFILENRDVKVFSDAEKNMFLQEGANDVIYAGSEGYESFSGKVIQILEELYMESQYQSFSGRGFALDYMSRPQNKEGSGRIEVLFYELKKIAAIDATNRDMVLSAAHKPDVRFSDVIGAESAKNELGYFINYLKNPKSYVLSGGKPPKGVLLFGPPGTGKTMLAKAMAGESEVAFLQTSASEFKNKYVGESEANIRRIFATAKKYAPAVIFIDEIDAIGKKRTGSDAARVEESMLNALLTEMDGFDPPSLSRPVFVLAATNFGLSDREGSVSAELDEALLRRFDNKIYVDLPTKKEREKYISLIIGKNNQAYDVSEATIANIADRTTGQSLAVIQNILELALRNANKAGTQVDDSVLITSFEDYMYGEKKEFTPEYYHSVAVHEAGHALVSYKCGVMPSFITIESRSNFGGYMQRESGEDIPNFSKEDMLGRVRTALAGRAAELVFFDKGQAINTGASSDLERATDLAFSIVGRYGMADDGTFAVLDKNEILRSALASDYLDKVNVILAQEMDRAVTFIRQSKEVVQRIAGELERENHLTGERFKEIVRDYKI